jgi:hypothetical protein
MTTDLTTITTPFGLLDKATQKALRECGGPWEFYSNFEGWLKITRPDFSYNMGVTYRLKPQPPKPREWWMKRGHGWSMNVLEGDDAAYLRSQGFILVREVL